MVHIDHDAEKFDPDIYKKCPFKGSAMEIVGFRGLNQDGKPAVLWIS